MVLWSPVCSIAVAVAVAVATSQGPWHLIFSKTINIIHSSKVSRFIDCRSVEAMLHTPRLCYGRSVALE